MRSQMHKIQNFYIPKQPLTFRMKLSLSVTIGIVTTIRRNRRS